MATSEPDVPSGQDVQTTETRGSSTTADSIPKQRKLSTEEKATQPSQPAPTSVPHQAHDGVDTEQGERLGAVGPASAGQSYHRRARSRAHQTLFGTRRRKIISSLVIVAATILVILLSTLLTLLPRRGAGGSTFGSNSQADNSSPIVVDVSYGKYRGVELPNGVVQWLGMRYAGPPTGVNRFAAPIPPVPFDGVQDANQTLPGCVGVGPGTKGTSEYCTSIDVYSPGTASPSSKLPVWVFIQGGGNQASTAHYNGSRLIAATGMDTVFVTFTYRVGAYGFLASSEVQANASLNNGYKDQRYAVQWVKDHIEAFGGDPDSITLGGQSAGAGAVVAQLAAYGQTSNNGLFHSAIIESPSTPPIRTISQQQYQYDDLVTALNCTNSSNTLTCLRAVPHDTFLAHVGVAPYPDGNGVTPVFGWNPVVDNDFCPSDPITLISNGQFVSVPTLIGDVTDEGTIFVPKNLTNATAIEDFLEGNFPNLNSTELDEVDALYNLSDPNPPPYWHRTSDVYGELRYTCPSLDVTKLITKHNNENVWRYRFDVLDPSNAETKGVFHGSELTAIFGPTSGTALRSFLPNGPNANVVPLMQGYWSSFIRKSDPNACRQNGAPAWATWNEQQQQLHILANNSTMESIPSSQQERCDYLASIAQALQQ